MSRSRWKADIMSPIEPYCAASRAKFSTAPMPLRLRRTSSASLRASRRDSRNQTA